MLTICLQAEALMEEGSAFNMLENAESKGFCFALSVEPWEEMWVRSPATALCREKWSRPVSGLLGLLAYVL